MNTTSSTRGSGSGNGNVRSILISGAGIAGPSLAYWLHRHGFAATVVERSAFLRDSGGAVDFRGEQVKLLKAMGIFDAVKAAETGMGDQVVIDRAGEPVMAFSSAFFSGEVEVERGDLARILFEATREYTDYVFGDWIVGLDQRADGVDVTFASGAAATYDLVVGADGLHSGVRRLAFGPEEQYRTDLGWLIAGFTAPNDLGLDHEGRIYNVPGCGVMAASARDRSRLGVGFVFHAPGLLYDRHDVAAQKDLVAATYADAGWETPSLLQGMREADDLYFDTLSQIHMDRWSTGRVVLLGDAAWCAGPGGSGTGMAMMGAHVLAGELAAATNDHPTAFAAYERTLRPAAKIGQKQGKGSGAFLAPINDKKIATRNKAYKMLTRKLVAGFFNWLTARAANAVEYKEYPTTAATAPALPTTRDSRIAA
ncbi:monooxygenase FAD-binding [Catenulispora acidiphila DSM 44928]|uniref:Monooxygenase FAD-binding n=1 Tax=Catenulispora acidiphila (strain DSM 44928 / JCM 14897 / NBRC 102108 / NRRL B-24433 / ID139908) TaxID=479433 RepID=C7Q2L8_CATAD|nr:FAD-dependent monooxygenase [Catenulispora acidiphila]ACU69860.1 monooxygenase FAD-binding [Catenulispora acidiphila DSM 44928]